MNGEGVASVDLKNYLLSQAQRVDRKLEELLPSKETRPSLIHEAMRYSVFSGGKRIRPILTLACAEACGGNVEEALIPACALEMFHTYSLVHDDLPCLDNDDYRRDQPTAHKKYGEAYALLAGDGLLTTGFQVLGLVKDPQVAVRLIQEIGQAIGTQGMIGGQVVDKQAEENPSDIETLEYINLNKTAQLMRVSCLAGALVAGVGASVAAAVARFGECLGLAFQMVDDIMDSDGYIKFISKAETHQQANILTQEAKQKIEILGDKSGHLIEIADFMLARKH